MQVRFDFIPSQIRSFYYPRTHARCERSEYYELLYVVTCEGVRRTWAFLNGVWKSIREVKV